MEAAGKKKMLAVLVGCNYGGTEYELQGCINDVHAMRDVLVGRFGFAPADVTVLTDDHKSGTGGELPTGANVKRVLSDMVARAAPEDVLFFHFSGHGTLVPPVGGRTRRHGHGHRDDEAIVPCDFNLITDVDFRALVDRVPAGATFTMVSDSCHSGGLIDQEKEQIGPTATSGADRHLHAGSSRTPRCSDTCRARRAWTRRTTSPTTSWRSSAPTPAPSSTTTATTTAAVPPRAPTTPGSC